jgi:hypothetical protein
MEDCITTTASHSNRLRNLHWCRCPVTFRANTLNIPRRGVGWVDCSALIGAFVAFHVTADAALPINRSYRFYYLREDWL